MTWGKVQSWILHLNGERSQRSSYLWLWRSNRFLQRQINTYYTQFHSNLPWWSPHQKCNLFFFPLKKSFLFIFTFTQGSSFPKASCDFFLHFELKVSITGWYTHFAYWKYGENVIWEFGMNFVWILLITLPVGYHKSRLVHSSINVFTKLELEDSFSKIEAPF